MNNLDNSVQQTPTIQPLPDNQSVNTTNTSPKINLPIIIGIVLLVTLVSVGAYLLGIKRGQNTSLNINEQSFPTSTLPPNTSLPTNIPSQVPEINLLGMSKISFAESGNEIYLKHEVNLVDSKVEFPNDKSRTMTKVYSQDEFLEPKELTNINTANNKWADIVAEDIKDSLGSKSILISDRLFSFKKIPGTNSFIFVVEWSRSAGQNQGPWSPYQFERVMFYYDRSQGAGKLNKVEIFTKENNKFPKIDTFSQDNRYVSLLLFECWNCGGHKPETLLLDLKTLKIKNIGKVEQFSWGQNGAYQYKDYVVIECKEPQPGECTQDPSTLPLKTGQF